MAKRHKVRARQRRFELLFELGGCCRECQAVERLEFDCIEPCGDAHHRMDTSHRLSFYYRQHKQKNLQVLCKKCHGKKSVREHPQYQEEPDPF